jgi:hypothetical protein
MATRATKPGITAEQRAELSRHFRFFRNTGSVDTGKWMFAPFGWDGAFECYSEGYATRREAELGAWKIWTEYLTREEQEEFEAEADAAGR